MDSPAVDIAPDDPLAAELAGLVQTGDVTGLARRLGLNPELARARLVDPNGGIRTLLHVATDWPGYFPHAPEIVRLLADAGADLDARTTAQGETPLHWAASSDDVEVAAALIEVGADVDATGGSIAGSPLANAVGYGCWHVARLLVAHGAVIDSFWQAAALGLTEHVERLLDTAPTPTQDDLDEAFWQSCHGGQRRMAELLLDRGANIRSHPGYSEEQPIAIAVAPDTRRQALADWLQEKLAADGSS